jgi:hypothetical protein
MLLTDVGRKMVSRRCSSKIKDLEGSEGTRNHGRHSNALNREGDGRQELIRIPRGKGKLADVRTKARPSSKMSLGPGTNHFGRNFKSLKGWRRTTGPGVEAIERDRLTTVQQRIEDAPLQKTCNTTETRHNSAEIRREPRRAPLLKLAIVNGYTSS